MIERRNPHLPRFLDPQRDDLPAGITILTGDKVRAIGLRAVADALGVDLTELALASGEAVIEMQVESPFTRGGKRG